MQVVAAVVVAQLKVLEPMVVAMRHSTQLVVLVFVAAEAAGLEGLLAVTVVAAAATVFLS